VALQARLDRADGQGSDAPGGIHVKSPRIA
jgi:hypothetical protein